MLMHFLDAGKVSIAVLYGSQYQSNVHRELELYYNMNGVLLAINVRILAVWEFRGVPGRVQGYQSRGADLKAT